MKEETLKSWKEVTIRLEELHTREDDIKIQSVKEVKVWINPEEWRSIFSDLLMKNKVIT